MVKSKILMADLDFVIHSIQYLPQLRAIYICLVRLQSRMARKLLCISMHQPYSLVLHCSYSSNHTYGPLRPFNPPQSFYVRYLLNTHKLDLPHPDHRIRPRADHLPQCFPRVRIQPQHAPHAARVRVSDGYALQGLGDRPDVYRRIERRGGEVRASGRECEGVDSGCVVRPPGLNCLCSRRGKEKGI